MYIAASYPQRPQKRSVVLSTVQKQICHKIWAFESRINEGCTSPFIKTWKQTPTIQQAHESQLVNFFIRYMATKNSSLFPTNHIKPAFSSSNDKHRAAPISLISPYSFSYVMLMVRMQSRSR